MADQHEKTALLCSLLGCNASFAASLLEASAWDVDACVRLATQTDPLDESPSPTVSASLSSSGAVSPRVSHLSVLWEERVLEIPVDAQTTWRQVQERLQDLSHVPVSEQELLNWPLARQPRDADRVLHILAGRQPQLLLVVRDPTLQHVSVLFEGERFTVDADTSRPIVELKHVLEERTGIPVADQRLARCDQTELFDEVAALCFLCRCLS